MSEIVFKRASSDGICVCVIILWQPLLALYWHSPLLQGGNLHQIEWIHLLHVGVKVLIIKKTNFVNFFFNIRKGFTWRIHHLISYFQTFCYHVTSPYIRFMIKVCEINSRHLWWWWCGVVMVVPFNISTRSMSESQDLCDWTSIE